MVKKKKKNNNLVKTKYKVRIFLQSKLLERKQILQKIQEDRQRKGR